MMVILGHKDLYSVTLSVALLWHYLKYVRRKFGIILGSGSAGWVRTKDRCIILGFNFICWNIEVKIVNLSKL